jgi:hypothetical protein
MSKLSEAHLAPHREFCLREVDRKALVNLRRRAEFAKAKLKEQSKP